MARQKNSTAQEFHVSELVDDESPAPVQAAATVNPSERVFKHSQVVMTDTFKLEVAFMLKNLAVDGQDPDFHKTEHAHFFRTVDHRGKKQDTCTPVGGHFHEVKWQKSPDGSISIQSISPAMRFVTEGRGSNRKKVMRPLEHDTHKHAITYLRSDETRPSEVSKEYIKFQATVTQPAAIDGILG